MDLEVIMENEKYELIKLMNDRIYEQLNYAEAKNGILTGLLGGGVAAMLSSLPEISCELRWLKIYLLIVGGLFILAMCISLISFLPNTKKLDNKRVNYMFWGDVAAQTDVAKYLNDVTKNPIQDLAEQNMHVARIVTRKQLFFKVALKISLFALCPIVFIVYLIVTKCRVTNLNM